MRVEAAFFDELGKAASREGSAAELQQAVVCTTSNGERVYPKKIQICFNRQPFSACFCQQSLVIVVVMCQHIIRVEAQEFSDFAMIHCENKDLRSHFLKPSFTFSQLLALGFPCCFCSVRVLFTATKKVIRITDSARIGGRPPTRGGESGGNYSSRKR